MSARVVARRLLPVSLLALLALGGACGPPAENFTLQDPYGPVTWQPGQWTIVWQDEFDGPANSPPDPAKWTHELGGTGWGNGELQNYTDSLTNSALDGNGNLVITARAEMSGGNAYSSARLTTQGLYARAYGRFEARMRLANGRGLWPAFWLLGDDFDTVGWPRCGELDVVEEKGGEPGAITGSVHGPQASAGFDNPVSKLVHVAGGADTDFHVYAVEWDPGNIVFLVDDVPYLQSTPKRRPTWVYDHPYFMMLNLAVGGLYPGNPDATTPFPASIAIDYVRVSARAGDGGADEAAAPPEDAAAAPEDAAQVDEGTATDETSLDAGTDGADSPSPG